MPPPGIGDEQRRLSRERRAADAAREAAPLPGRTLEMTYEPGVPRRLPGWREEDVARQERETGWLAGSAGRVTAEQEHKQC